MNHKTVVLNAAKMNFDGNLDFSVLSEDVTAYDDTDQDQLLSRIQGAAEGYVRLRAGGGGVQGGGRQRGNHLSTSEASDQRAVF